MISCSFFTLELEIPLFSTLIFFLKTLLGKLIVIFFLFSNVVCIFFLVFLNLGQWFLWIVLLMHKRILKDFCQYRGRLIGIFFIPFILLNKLIPLIQLTTQTIEYNLCPIYLLPLLCSHQCIAFLLLKYCTFSL